jgi:hypothetical protein
MDHVERLAKASAACGPWTRRASREKKLGEELKIIRNALERRKGK